MSASSSQPNTATATTTTTTTTTPDYQVLLCVSGMSPAIITETLYALITQKRP